MARNRKKKGSFKFKLCLFLLLISAISALFLIFFQYNIYPVAISISEATVKKLTSQAVNDAVYSAVTSSIRYDDIVEVKCDSDGKITMLSTNSGTVNLLSKTALKMTDENLKAIGEEVVYLPIGAFTGSPLLSGQGPGIELRIVPVGNTSCQFVSEFTSAGINQTKHSIYIEVTAEMRVILPAIKNTVVAKTQALVCESILVGEVPNTYLDFGGSQKILNLLP